ncbi:hypothetical protein CIL05_07515 [Virgibacillus profundi]|uniref:Uncharacterized protein n=1 Tax=Virgibacillus profundi TaxID=2024555 RepID=A0A2A2IEY6_9BACI|nr:hypothetical protein [Virgibacillus profundi]PAV30309.1 hypothetical protein CIL05_07515 [Virgibacillus profundi]PXY54481.1 hypothetical protein CIT14_07600 [Virgibacillus profundi]
MTVKELVTELLEYDMGANVEIKAKFNDDEEMTDFKVEKPLYNDVVELFVDLSDYEMITKEDLEDLVKETDEYNELKSHM